MKTFELLRINSIHIDTIFILETCIVVIVSHFKLHEDLDEILTFIAISQVLGIFLKLIYYFQFHIWKNAFTSEHISRNVGNSMRNVLASLKFTSQNSNSDSDALMQSKDI